MRHGFGAACIVAVLALPGLARADEKLRCVSASDQGQQLRDDGKYRKAREAFATCAREACPAIVRHDCIKWLADLEQNSPTVVVDAKDGKGNDLVAVTVTVDGAPLVSQLDGKPVLVDPGEHVFRYEAPGFPPVEEHVVIHAGEKDRMLNVQFGSASTTPSSPTPSATPRAEAEAPPPTSSGGVPLATWILGGVAVAAFGTEAYFGLSGLSDRNSLRSQPCAASASCPQGDVDSIRTKFTVADVALGVGVVSAALAAYFFVSHHGSSAPPAQSAHLVLGPMPGIRF